MPLFTMFAIYFIVWWIALFACLPVGVRTQAEAGDVVPGSAESAPHRFQFWKVIGLTTVVSAVICGIWYVAVHYFGMGLDSLPNIVPDNTRNQ